MPAQRGGSAASQLNYVIAARDSQFQRVADRVTRRLERLERQGRQTSMSVRALGTSLRLPGVGRLLGGVALIAAARRLSGSIDEALSRVDRLGKAARNLDLPVSTFQAWSQAAQEAGVSQDRFRSALQRFQRFLGNTVVEGTETYTRVWARLGIQLRNEQGRLRSVSSLLYEVQDALSGVNDVAERQSLIQSLFGRGGGDLAALLSEGSQGLRQFTQEFQNARRGLDADTVAIAESLQNMRDAAGGELTSQLDRLLIRMDRWLGVTEALTAAQRGLAAAARGVADSLPDRPPTDFRDAVYGTGFDVTRFSDPSGRGESLTARTQRDVVRPGFPATVPSAPPPVSTPSPRIPETASGISDDREAGLRELAESISFRMATIERERVREAEREQERLDGISRRLTEARYAAEAQLIEKRQQEAVIQAEMESRARAETIRQLDEIRRAEQARIDQARVAFTNLFVSVISGTQSLESALLSVLNNIAAQAASNLASSFFGGSGGLGSLLPILFGRQRGGPVTTGQAYLVGETGPEVFVPRVSGQVAAMPSVQAAAPTVNLTFNISSTDGPGVRAALVEAEPRLTRAALSMMAVQQSRPGSALGRQNRGAA